MAQLTPSAKTKLEQKLAAIEEKLAKMQKIDRGTTTSWGGSFEKERLQNELYLLTEQKHEIEEQLKNADIVKITAQTGMVTMGTSVRLLINKEEITYTFVSAPEADHSKGHISIESPIGIALQGKKEGHVVKVDIPAGTLHITILELLQ